MINDKSICEKCVYEELNNEAIKLMYCNKCDNYSDKEINKDVELLKELKLTNKVLDKEELNYLAMLVVCDQRTVVRKHRENNQLEEAKNPKDVRQIIIEKLNSMYDELDK